MRFAFFSLRRHCGYRDIENALIRGFRGRQAAFVFFSPLLFSSMAQDISQLTQQIVALIRDNTQGGNRWAGVLGNAGVSLCIPQSGASNEDMDDSAINLPFCTITLDFAVFPHASPHPRAESLGVEFGGATGSAFLTHAGLIDKISAELLIRLLARGLP